MRGRRLSAACALALLIALAALPVAFPSVRPFARGVCVAALAAFVALLVARAWLRARPADAAVAPAIALGLASAAGLLLLFQNVLVHDALWYYGYLRSALVQGDLDMYDEFVLMNPNGMYLPPPSTPVFHLGTSILQAPLTILVRPLALFLGRQRLLPGGDGYGPLEVGAATFSSVLLALGGVALTHRLARRLAPGPASAVAQVALLFGSPLAYFTFIWPGYPHDASVFLAAAFLLLWAGAGAPAPQGERRPGPSGEGESRFFLLGLLGGALALVHPQDALYLVLPLIDLGARLARRRETEAADDGGDRTPVRHGALLVLGAVLGFAPQLAAWRLTSGRFLPHVYGEIGDPFLWSRPAFVEVLFSGYNGLISWTPLCGLAACGMAFLRRSQPRLFRGFLIVLGLEWWSISSYGYWWGGASFGARYFLSAYPVLGVGLALLFARLARRLGLLTTGVLAAPWVYWNLLLMAQFRLEWIRHNRPPDFAAILRRQVFEAPAALLAGLCGSLGWNKVSFLENLRAAAEEGNAWRALGVMSLGTILAIIVVLWIVWLCGAAERVERHGARFVAAAAIAATVAVALVAPGHGARRIVAEGVGGPVRMRPETFASVRFASDGTAGVPDEPTAVVIRTAASPPADRRMTLDLITFLHNGEAVPQGVAVARVTAVGSGCDGASWPLRAGIETAETAPDRFEVLGLMRHGLDQTIPIQSWWQDDQSARHYWGHAYLASWGLPPGCRPERAVLRTLAGAGELEVRRLVIEARAAGRP